ncbi:hypothetical protein DXU04_38480 [Bradyrhizobium diazoefficiens]
MSARVTGSLPTGSGAAVSRPGSAASIRCVSVRGLGHARVLARLLADAALADDEGAVDPGVLLGLDTVLRLPPFLRIGLKSGLRTVALGYRGGSRCSRWPRGGALLIGIFARTIPGKAGRLEGRIGSEMRLRRDGTSGKRQRQQEEGGRFDHDAALCTRELAEVAPIMFKNP